MRPGRSKLLNAEGLNREIENALQEGGERNGVCTAVEDILHELGDKWRWMHLPGIHGLGLLIPIDHAAVHPRLSTMTSQLDLPPILRAFIESIESDRLKELIHAEGLEKQMTHRGETIRRMQARIAADQSMREEYASLKHEVHRLHAYMDAHEHQWIEDSRRLRHILQTRSMRWTAWIRNLVGLLRG